MEKLPIVSKKLSGILFKNTLGFDCHVSDICKTASEKLSALSQVANYMDNYQDNLVIRTLIFPNSDIVL